MEPDHVVVEDNPDHVVDTTLVKKRKRTGTANGVRIRYGDAENMEKKAIPDEVGTGHETRFYEPDGSLGSNATVIATAITAMKGEVEDKLQLCSYFASAVAAYLPDLTDNLKEKLFDQGCRLRIYSLPDENGIAGIDTEANEQFSSQEAHTLMGSLILVLFKQIQPAGYNKYMSSRIVALGGKLGISRKDIAKFKIPLNMDQAEIVRGIMGADYSLKREILLYLMYLCDVDRLIASMARYACMILSWNEMTAFVFIQDKLALPKSPILNDPEIRHEVVKYSETVAAVGGCDFPQFFRYFGNGQQEHMLQKSRFPILAAVAHKLKNMELKGSTTEQYVSTIRGNERKVDELVKAHISFMAKRRMGVTNAVKFITKDPTVVYEEEDET